MVNFWIIILLVFNLVWLGLNLFMLPGNWFMVISTCLFAWWQAEHSVFSIYTLVIITVLALLGELIEFMAGAGGAKKAGASWLGSLGAIIGAIVGGLAGTVIIPIPLVGTLIGACLGAGGGTFLFERLSGKRIEHSLKFGVGAGLGAAVGIISKLSLGGLIWLIVAIAAFYG
jgi:uncharacterized protein YqgC (DUF456 family)